MSIFGVGTHSHFSVDQSSFLCVVFVFLRKHCVFYSEEEEQKSGFSSPTKKIAEPCPSRVQAVSKVFDLLYGQRYTTWLIRHVSDACPARVHVSDM